MGRAATRNLPVLSLSVSALSVDLRNTMGMILRFDFTFILSHHRCRCELLWGGNRIPVQAQFKGVGGVGADLKIEGQCYLEKYKEK